MIDEVRLRTSSRIEDSSRETEKRSRMAEKGAPEEYKGFSNPSGQLDGGVKEESSRLMMHKACS